MNIVALIPVVNVKLTDALLFSIEQNTLLPSRVILIDNTGGKIPYYYPTTKLSIQYIKPTEPMSVNGSWRYGIETARKFDAISILNDDIYLNPHFFARNARVLQSFPLIGVSCPFTVSSMTELKTFPFDQYEIRGMKKREGWAFTISALALSHVPPIPDHVCKTFCGDDWIYYWTAGRRVFSWQQDTKNMVWHKGSTTVNRTGAIKQLKAEKNAFAAYLNDYVKGITK